MTQHKHPVARRVPPLDEQPYCLHCFKVYSQCRCRCKFCGDLIYRLIVDPRPGARHYTKHREASCKGVMHTCPDCLIVYYVYENIPDAKNGLFHFRLCDKCEREDKL